jgi:hypothetical protein
MLETLGFCSGKTSGFCKVVVPLLTGSGAKTEVIGKKQLNPFYPGPALHLGNFKKLQKGSQFSASFSHQLSARKAEE